LTSDRGAFTDFNTLLSERGRSLPDRVAIESPDQGTRITFGELDRLTNRLAHFLRGRGVKPGDRVSVLSENSLEALVLFWGILRGGVVLNTINVEIREKNVGQILSQVRPKLVLWSRELPADPRGLGEADASWIAFGAAQAPRPREDLFALLEGLPETPVPETPGRRDLGFINYTSGTTDAPKGVVVTHEAYFAMNESTVDRLGISAADTILDYRHFSWSSPQILSIGPSLQTGARLVLARKFSQARFFEWLRAYDVTVAVGIPTVINMLLSRPVAVTRADLPHLRFMTSSTAPLSLDRQLEFERQYGIPIVQLAGGTETGFMAGNPPERRRRGSIGLPTLNMTVRILDDAGRECGPEQEGEMVVSGRQMASGYLVDADTIVPIPPEGHHTGDLARCDREGYVYITGRKKDIIIKGGVNIAALEITNALLQHPDAAEAATIGVPDDIYGETVVSFVVPRPGRAATADAFAAHCRKALAEFKWPKAIVLLEAIPKNANGKVARDELRTIWSARAGHPA
jgi:acyl-coenzyme A synthetase/AMP-(fatty) acid ligase